jgi:hypothetical protein
LLFVRSCGSKESNTGDFDWLLRAFPFYLTNIAGIQIAQVIHSVVAILFIALILAHINWRHQMVKDASAGCRSFVPATLSRDTLGS